MGLQSMLSGRARPESAETHRLSAIANIENALHHRDDLTDDQQKRLKRLLKILEASANDNNGRKFDVLQVTVVPVLVSMGLIKED